MNYHIVRMNETISKIANIYNLSEEEIKSINTHIRDWDNLIQGTKIKLPAISEILHGELDDVEPFIEDYYPRVEKEKYNTDIIKNNPIIPVEPVIDNSNESPVKQQTQPAINYVPKQVPKPAPYYYPNPYYGMYYNPNYYPQPQGERRTKRGKK